MGKTTRDRRDSMVHHSTLMKAIVPTETKMATYVQTPLFGCLESGRAGCWFVNPLVTQLIDVESD